MLNFLRSNYLCMTVIIQGLNVIIQGLNVIIQGLNVIIQGLNVIIQGLNVLLPGYIFHGTGERNRGYALLMTANKPETALYRTPTFSLLLASHGGNSLCAIVIPVVWYGYTVVCSRSVGRGLRAEVYVMVECSYFAYTLRLTVCP